MGQEYVWAAAKRIWRDRLLNVAMNEEQGFDNLKEVKLIMEKLCLQETEMKGCGREGIRAILAAQPIKKVNWVDDRGKPKHRGTDEVLDQAVDGQMPQSDTESLSLPNSEQIGKLCRPMDE